MDWGLAISQTPYATSLSVATVAAAAAGQTIEAAGLHLPSWGSLALGARPRRTSEDEERPEPGSFAHGWQFHAARALDEACREGLLPELSRSDQAHLRSQSGPGAAATFTAVPTQKELRISPEEFRVLLLRRLRLALPLAARSCRCRLFLDPLGDHRAACSTAGVLVRRAVPMESAAARICREAGARVRTHVCVCDLNVGVLALG